MRDGIKKLYYKYTDEFVEISRNYNIPIATILTILQVETNDDDGFTNIEGVGRSLIIRIELHKFKKYCPVDLWAIHEGRFRWDSDKPWKEQQFRMQDEDMYKSFHGDQFEELMVFNACKDIDQTAAYKAISMGLPQVMGFNYEKLGFTSPIEMYNEFNSSTINQIYGMMDFMGSRMLNALRKEVFFTFAKGYNGIGQAVKYNRLLIKAKMDIDSWLED
jgi:N-acetylmuramidase